MNFERNRQKSKKSKTEKQNFAKTRERQNQSNSRQKNVLRAKI